MTRGAPNRWMVEIGALARLAAPIIVAQLALISMNTVDTIMSGQLGSQALAAVALGGCLWVPAYIFAGGLLMAVSPTVAHLHGAGKDREVGHQVRQGLWLSVLASVPAACFLWNAGPILAWMDVPEAVRPVTQGYLRAMACGVPAVMAYTVLRSYCEGVSDTVSIMAVAFIGLPSNVFGNWVFMYGKLGLPELGAVGTGVASAVVMWVMLASLATRIAVSGRHRRFECFRHFDLPDMPEILALARLGLPIGIGLFLECGLFSLVALCMGSLGEAVVAGHQVALNFAAVTFMVPLGISMAITARVGQAMGRKDPVEARLAGTVGIAMAVGVMTLAAGLMLAFPRQIAAIYTPDPAVQDMAVMLLGLAAIFQISDGLQVSGAGALRGLKDATVPMLITLTAYWGVGWPLAWWLGLQAGLGPRGLWIGLIAGLTAAAVLLNLRFFWRTRWLIRVNSPSVEQDMAAAACGKAAAEGIPV